MFKRVDDQQRMVLFMVVGVVQLSIDGDQRFGLGPPKGLPPPAKILASKTVRGSAASILAATSLNCCASCSLGSGPEVLGT
jgi:hypothetical protein